ncbi:Tumor necrosis factor receptor superfamily member 19 [Abyssicoccus albus]|uniref:Uncharacterized protein n=1 Tax=Abyssicoccus albus TaxID=1817405 RepID=A0A3N5BKE6_9BACL|nr:hypothetical protein EDD62_0809 [Abyssicoccus albus]
MIFIMATALVLTAVIGFLIYTDTEVEETSEHQIYE